MSFTRDSSHGRPPVSVTTALLALNAVVFLMQLWLGGDGDPQQARQPVEDALALTAGSIRHWELWRLLTCTFVHYGWKHIILNMWGLFFFGQMLEAQIGRGRFLALYLLSGMLGSGLWLAFNWQVPAELGGASGCVFGVVAAAAVFFPDNRIMLMFPPVPMKLKTFAVLFVVIEIISELAVHDRVAHLAHLGGMLVGFVFALWLLPRNRRRNLLRKLAPEAGGALKPDASLHRCALCGATEKSHPQAEFRYCTKCEPAACFCTEHLHGHAHIQAEPKG